MATSAAVVKEYPATSFAKDQLKAIIERLEEEKKTISDDFETFRDDLAEKAVKFQ
jgi:uncharacterized protein (UPF0335 family)